MAKSAQKRKKSVELCHKSQENCHSASKGGAMVVQFHKKEERKSLKTNDLRS